MMRLFKALGLRKHKEPTLKEWQANGGTASIVEASVHDLPPEFDPNLYQSLYEDLKVFSDATLLQHFMSHGRAEGRKASMMNYRGYFRDFVQKYETVLEIGPFANPITCGPNVAYFDVLDRVGLQARAKAIEAGYDPEQVPHIDFVSPAGDLSIVNRTFDAVVSVHCIEHQPDLVAHLSNVGHLLEPGGCYFLIIPDHRYCFDHFIPKSTIAGILEAHVAKRPIHTVKSLVEHRALITHNDAFRHWASDHADTKYFDSIPERAQAALREYAHSAGTYIDVHAWQFTPESFRQTMQILFQGGFSELEPVRVYGTLRNEFEFMAVLQKPVS